MSAPSELHKRLLQANLGGGGLPPRRPPQGRGGGARGGRGSGFSRRDYTPSSWTDYFDRKQEVRLSEEGGDVFTVYTKGVGDGEAQAPLLVLLHGGGFSALSWSLFTRELLCRVRARALAIDLRGHGDSRHRDEHDLSADTLARDVGLLVRRELSSRPAPSVVLVGHSMGGALAVHVALKEELPGLAGVCVIDVVEGTAMDALGSMPNFLRSRPSRFRSLAHAIEWSVRSGQVRNVESAKVSIPGQLKNARTGRCATGDVGCEADDAGRAAPPTARDANAILEEEGDEDEAPVAAPAFKMPRTEAESSGDGPTAPTADADPYTWRVDLAASEPHWPGWFRGLSANFLAVPASKLLLLAGIDRLDRDLTVGQMQGKFQMQVLPQAGHAVHEDLPDRVADVLATFLVRNKLAEAEADFQKTFPAC